MEARRAHRGEPLFSGAADDGEFNGEQEEIMSKLTVIASKYRPFREDKDPRTWVLYKSPSAPK
jgi:hypothetical protein